MSEPKMIVVTGTNKFQLLWDSSQRELCERLTFYQGGHHKTHIIDQSTIFRMRQCSLLDLPSLTQKVLHWPKKSVLAGVEESIVRSSHLWWMDAKTRCTNCTNLHHLAQTRILYFHFLFSTFAFSFLLRMGATTLRPDAPIAQTCSIWHELGYSTFTYLLSLSIFYFRFLLPTLKKKYIFFSNWFPKGGSDIRGKFPNDPELFFLRA